MLEDKLHNYTHMRRM